VAKRKIVSGISELAFMLNRRQYIIKKIEKNEKSQRFSKIKRGATPPTTLYNSFTTFALAQSNQRQYKL